MKFNLFYLFGKKFIFNRNLPTDHSVGLNDVTSKYTVVNVIGPKATQLLSELSNSDLKLPSFTYKVGEKIFLVLRSCKSHNSNCAPLMKL